MGGEQMNRTLNFPAKYPTPDERIAGLAMLSVEQRRTENLGPMGIAASRRLEAVSMQINMDNFAAQGLVGKRVRQYNPPQIVCEICTVLGYGSEHDIKRALHYVMQFYPDAFNRSRELMKGA
jgi:hypothetical protein